MQKIIIISISILVGALYAIGNVFALQLHFSGIDIQSLENTFSSVNFVAPGNNFVGSIFWLDTKAISPQTISLNNHSKTCTKQVRWLYFNAQRGKRLWPLDQETLELLQQQNSWYNNLELTGWWYTTCDSGANYGIFGAITYTRWQLTSHVIAGVKIDYANNRLYSGMANNLQYFDNKTPIGYIYDSNGGVGFVWGSGEQQCHQELIDYINTGGSIISGFVYSGTSIISTNTKCPIYIGSGNTAMETMRNMIIHGSVGISKSMDTIQSVSLLGKTNNKTIIYNGSDINSSTIINAARQKRQQLCQWKTKNPDLSSTNDTLLCYENTDITIDLTQTSLYQNKTIIVSDGNVIIQGGMQKNSPSLDIFIDRGRLYLPTDPVVFQSFDTQGFPDEKGISRGVYLKGIFIINGILLWWVPWAQQSFGHKLHIQGKLTTLNTPLEPNNWRVQQINEMFSWSLYQQYINLQNIFTRTCNLNGTGSDENTSCNQSNTIATTPIVIINGNYPSRILQ